MNKTYTPRYICLFPYWSGTEVKCSVHEAQTTHKLPSLNCISKSRQHALRAYCPSIILWVARSQHSIGHLICTFISENQGLEKSSSVSNLRKISGPAHLHFFFSRLEFFFSLSTGFFSDLYHKPEKNSGDKLKKKSGALKKDSGVQKLKFS